MKTSTLTIKETYHDALFFATATVNEKKKFHLPLSELRVLEKLLHYSKKQENITWSSENISKHIFTTPTAIDKIIQRLQNKGYINVSTTKIHEKAKLRTIFINWDMFKKINQLIEEFNTVESELDSTETPDTNSIEAVSEQEPIQFETKEIEDGSEDILAKIKRLGYSDIEFRNINGQNLLVPNLFKEYWDEILTKKGHVSNLKRNSNQHSFNYELSRMVENDYE